MKILQNKHFLGTGLFVTLLCCFTPMLVIFVGFAGLSWFTGYLDYGLTLLLGFFIMALTFLVYDRYNKKYVVYVGGAIMLGFTTLYFMWSILLGVLVLVGSIIAVIIYFKKFKRFCKSCEVKR